MKTIIISLLLLSVGIVGTYAETKYYFTSDPHIYLSP
jgi:hypothetical protein